MAKRNMRMSLTHTDLVFYHENDSDKRTTEETDPEEMDESEYSSWKVFWESFEYTFRGIMISYLAAYFLSQLLF